MNATVIIPFYNSQNYLVELFEALNNVIFDECDEVLLIDNGSTDDSANICHKFINEFPDRYKYYKYIEKPGSYAARNYAVSLAQGDILIFTDSDTKPVRNWIKEIKNNISEGYVIAGNITLQIENHNIWEYFDSFAHLNSNKEFHKNHVATANMSVYKTDFSKVGYFEERFSGGDYEWSTRAVSKGLAIKYCFNAIVYHPTRKTFEQIMMKECRIAYGTGNHYRNIHKSFWKLIFLYFLRIFKIDTNYKFSKFFYNNNFSIYEILKFNYCFFKIRIKQLLFSLKGYRRIDPRLIRVK